MYYNEDASICGIVHDMLLVLSLGLVIIVAFFYSESNTINAVQGVVKFNISYTNDTINTAREDTISTIYIVLSIVRAILYIADIEMNAFFRVLIIIAIIVINFFMYICAMVFVEKGFQNNLISAIAIVFAFYIILSCPRGFMGIVRDY